MGDKELQEFWEWCGGEFTTKTQSAMRMPDGSIFHVCPPIDLNNLFKYAVPKLHKKGLFLEMVVDKRFCRAVALTELGVKPKREYVGEDKDPAQALYKAIQEVRNGV